MRARRMACSMHCTRYAIHSEYADTDTVTDTRTHTHMLTCAHWRTHTHTPHTVHTARRAPHTARLANTTTLKFTRRATCSAMHCAATHAHGARIDNVSRGVLLKPF
eukprot:6053032-Alexandrium_andersonii.AAC.1